MDRRTQRLQTDPEFDEHKNINLRLTEYDEIFSVFDPRSHSEGALSVDFLEEAKRASIDKPTGQLEVRLLVPQRLRNVVEESIIKRRLKNHFEKHSKVLERKRRQMISSGTKFVVCGILMMFLTAFILYTYPSSNLPANFLLVVFEPAGWFFFWEGLDLILFESKKVMPELEFNEKMAKAYINFQSY